MPNWPAASMGRPVEASWSSQRVRDAWLIVHVVLVLLGYAALLFTAVAAILYLMQERELKRKKPRSFYHRLPPLGTLDELITRFMGVGFVLITLAVIVGSTWAFVELGTQWVAEPKIAISFLTWGIYLAMVFLRVSAGWRGRKAAVLAITALGCCALVSRHTRVVADGQQALRPQSLGYLLHIAPGAAVDDRRPIGGVRQRE